MYYPLLDRALQSILIDSANFRLTVRGCRIHLNSSVLKLLPQSGCFGVTKKAKAGRLGVSGPPLFLPKSLETPDRRPRLHRRRADDQSHLSCREHRISTSSRPEPCLRPLRCWPRCRNRKPRLNSSLALVGKSTGSSLPTTNASSWWWDLARSTTSKLDGITRPGSRPWLVRFRTA